MIHQLRDKRKIARRKLVIRNVIIIAVLLVLGALGVLSWSGKIFTVAGRPLWKARNNINTFVDSKNYLVRTKSSVFAENELLSKKNLELQNAMIDYQVIKAENDQLKELLGRMPMKNNFTLATILAKPNSSPYDTIIIDAGSDIGMTEGLKVFGNGSVPIGEITKVYPKNSLVILYSNPGQITEGILEGSNTSVELVGRGGGNFEMTIPLDLPSENGKLVLLPNTTSEIVAVVGGVLSTPTDPVKRVILRSPVNIQNLKWVEVKRD